MPNKVIFTFSKTFQYHFDFPEIFCSTFVSVYVQKESRLKNLNLAHVCQTKREEKAETFITELPTLANLLQVYR